MKLIDALELLKRPVSQSTQELTVFLACGFTPLHLETFLAAHLRSILTQHRVVVATGLFGDLIGNIERLEPADFQSLAAIIEWGDFDPRLGVRTLGGWQPTNLYDIENCARQSAARLQRTLMKAAEYVPTVVSLPTLPLPPMFPTSTSQAGLVETQLHHTVASLASSLCAQPGIKIINSQLLNETSPPAGRFDLKSEVASGFPYSLLHASEMASEIAGLLSNRPAKKGLITDLDDTLWAGILGEDGVNGISWHLESQTHMHGLYQQFLASLAGAGLLIGAASRNDPALVEAAFNRVDLLIKGRDIFPFEIHWSRKSESVRRILHAWNVAADSVVFVDDSPMEVAEVKAAFPEMECIVFPKNSYQGVWNLLKHLRAAFGKPFLTEEDSLRLSSIRESSAWRDTAESADGSTDDFLKAAEACVTFDCVKAGPGERAFELVNKTNQFNLNGKRLSESEWLTFFADPEAFLVTVSYSDKYGPLGRIAVILGKTSGRTVNVSGWVMSCRAFSRRIEHQCLKYLFERFDANKVVFDYEATPRNGPLTAFLREVLGCPPARGLTLTKESFDRKAPPLFHRVTGTVNV